MTFNAKLTYPLTDKIYNQKVIDTFNLLESISNKLDDTNNIISGFSEPEMSLIYIITKQIKADIENELIYNT